MSATVIAAPAEAGTHLSTALSLEAWAWAWAPAFAVAAEEGASAR
jgi:hypothetical protein